MKLYFDLHQEVHNLSGSVTLFLVEKNLSEFCPVICDHAVTSFMKHTSDRKRSDQVQMQLLHGSFAGLLSLQLGMVALSSFLQGIQCNAHLHLKTSWVHLLSLVGSWTVHCAHNVPTDDATANAESVVREIIPFFDVHGGASCTTIHPLQSRSRNGYHSSRHSHCFYRIQLLRHFESSYANSKGFLPWGRNGNLATSSNAHCPVVLRQDPLLGKISAV